MLMPMTSVQVRISEEQLRLIDRVVQAGRYPNRSEAIRDYLRKAQLWEVLERLLEMGEIEGQSESEIQADLERVRAEVYQKLIAPKRRQLRPQP
ncbi:MAG TPA: ribbon-helix-helix protein, CopG family [Candidatus Fraserbacteria bacterium]|nr:ribbon-helix-helix protein, CopG family [Candidatus Fraserbacteria bacterium]